MASLVRVKAANGTIYVYENESYWDRKEKKTKHKRKCIGHIEPETGEIVPNRKKGDAAARRRTGCVEDDLCTDHSCGVALTLDKCAEDIGLTEALKKAFPDDWAAILTCAYSLLCNGKALSHVEFWSEDHVTPYGKVLTSQTVSDLLLRITQDRQMNFFREWNKVCMQDKYYAVDVTSISSYSKTRRMVERGYNRDREKHLGQINLLLVTGAESGYPIYFRDLPGSLTDVVSLRDTIRMFDLIPLKRIHYCMDKGFYSAPNVDEFYATHSRFLMGIPFSCARARDTVKKYQDTIQDIKHLCLVDNDELYAVSELQKWNGHRFYLHTYFDPVDAAESIRDFHVRLKLLREKLAAGKLTLDDIDDDARYFNVKETPKRGRRVSYNTDAVKDFEKNRAGWFVLGSNDVRDADEALKVYRMRDRVEKSFDDLKNSLDMKRLRVHSDRRANARIFVQFIALILQTHLRAVLAESGWLPDRTLAEALAALDSVRIVTRQGKHRPLYTTLTKNQRLVLQAMGVSYPPCV